MCKVNWWRVVSSTWWGSKRSLFWRWGLILRLFRPTLAAWDLQLDIQQGSEVNPASNWSLNSKLIVRGQEVEAQCRRMQSCGASNRPHWDNLLVRACCHFLCDTAAADSMLIGNWVHCAITCIKDHVYSTVYCMYQNWGATNVFMRVLWSVKNLIYSLSKPPSCLICLNNLFLFFY